MKVVLINFIANICIYLSAVKLEVNKGVKCLPSFTEIKLDISGPAAEMRQQAQILLVKIATLDPPPFPLTCLYCSLLV